MGPDRPDRHLADDCDVVVGGAGASARWGDRFGVDAYPVSGYAADYTNVGKRNNPADLTKHKHVIEGSYETVGSMAARGVQWGRSVGKLIDAEQLGAGETYALAPGGALRAAREGVGPVQIDEHARVKDDVDRVMPGLYATGEQTGGHYHHHFPGSAALTRGAVFGRLAGEGAAAEALGA